MDDGCTWVCSHGSLPWEVRQMRQLLEGNSYVSLWSWFSDSHDMHKLQTCSLSLLHCLSLFMGAWLTVQALFVHVTSGMLLDCGGWPTSHPSSANLIAGDCFHFIVLHSISLSYILLTHLGEMGEKDYLTRCDVVVWLNDYYSKPHFSCTPHTINHEGYLAYIRKKERINRMNNRSSLIIHMTH